MDKGWGMLHDAKTALQQCTQSKLMSMLTLYFTHVGLSTLELCPHFYGTIFCRLGVDKITSGHSKLCKTFQLLTY